MINARKNVTAVLTSLLALSLFFASPAAAETGPELTPLTPEANGGDFPILPGGNGPDEPDDPFVLVPVEPLPMFLTASVAVSCTTETATVTVKNPSLNVFIAALSVDGSVVDSGNVGAKQQFVATFPCGERHEGGRGHPRRQVDAYEGRDPGLPSSCTRVSGAFEL